MGTCYSKNTNGARTSESKVPGQRYKDFKKKEICNDEVLPPERSPLKLSEKGLTKTDVSAAGSANSVASRSTNPDVVSKRLNEKFVDSGVVPSDSGIESIDNVQVDAGESTFSKQESDDLSKQLRYLSIDPSDNRNSPHDKDFVENGTVVGHDIMASGSLNGISASEFQSISDKADSNNKIKSTQVSKQSAVSLDTPSILLLAQEGSTRPVSYICQEKSSNNKAPLAEFDSIETNLNDSSFHNHQKRQSLLSEILDITESLCKCDFYSSEYCTRDHGISGAVTEVISDAFSSEIGASGQLHENGQLLDHPNIHYKGETVSDASTNSSHNCGSPSKKGLSLPKNVSFATHEEISDEALTSPASVPARKTLLKSKAAYPRPLQSVLMESHKTASELILSRKQKDFHKRSSSLGSVRGLTSDSSSDAPDCGTEDDVASLDLDSISRATSLSYNSIRQLVESTEDLVSFSYTAQPVTIDGVDCIVIPTVAFRQMQTDLATLKQQLLYLSSLMQGTEDLEQLKL